MDSPLLTEADPDPLVRALNDSVDRLEKNPIYEDVLAYLYQALIKDRQTTGTDIVVLLSAFSATLIEMAAPERSQQKALIELLCALLHHHLTAVPITAAVASPRHSSLPPDEFPKVSYDPPRS